MKCIWMFIYVYHEKLENNKFKLSVVVFSFSTKALPKFL